jgi:hypothetical protein
VASSPARPREEESEQASLSVVEGPCFYNPVLRVQLGDLLNSRGGC